MQAKLHLLTLLPSTFIKVTSFAQVPFVYDVENTGEGFAPPVLPALSELPTVELLTDPFEWLDGSGRNTSIASWSHRRAEIKAEIEHYEIGAKQNRPKDIFASYADGTLTLNVTLKL